MDDEASNSVINYKISTYFVILDRIKNELEKRKIAYDQLFEKYSFFLSIGKIEQRRNQRTGKMFSRYICR